MDFTLSNEQRAWQMTARKFAEEEIRPISLERDDIADPRETFDWEIIKKGSKLGFRTMAVPKEWGGHGTDFVAGSLERATVDAIQREAFLAMDSLARRFGEPTALAGRTIEYVRQHEHTAADWWWYYAGEVGAPRRSAAGL